jgi:hypothetical protein
MLQLAETAAAMAERRWPSGSGPVFRDAIRSVHEGLASMGELSAAGIAARWFPNSPLTIVPLALGLAAVMVSAEEAILMAANIGGDSDSVASIAGGVLGAMYPATVNQQWYEIVERVNHHDLVPLALELASLRRG